MKAEDHTRAEDEDEYGELSRRVHNYDPQVYRRWDALPQAERDAIPRAVLERSDFLWELYGRKLNSALVLAGLSGGMGSAAGWWNSR